MDQVTQKLKVSGNIDPLDSFAALAQSDQLWQQNTGAALRFLLSKVTAELNLNSCSLWLTYPNKPGLHCDFAYSPLPMSLINRSHFSLNEDSYFLSRIKTSVLTTFEGNHDPNLLSNRKDLPSATASLYKCGHFSGVLVLTRNEPETPWQANETTYITAISGLVSQVLVHNNLHENERLYRTLFNSLGDASFLLTDDHFADCNPAALKMFGCEYEQIVGQTPYRFSPLKQPDGQLSSEKAKEKISAAFDGQPQFFEWQHLRFNGTPFDAEVTLTTVEINNVTHILGSVRDISDRKEKEDHISQMNTLQQAIFDCASYGIISTDLQGTIQSFNKAAENMLGYTAQELVGQHNVELLHDNTEISQQLKKLSLESDRPLEPSFDLFVQQAKAGCIQEKEWTYITKEGKRFPGLISTAPLKSHTGEITGFLGILSDVTDKKRVQEDLLRSKREMEYRANHDSLTGLPNRSRFHECASNAINVASEQNKSIALLLLDLDRFKEVNDTLGHHVGDLLLQKLANLLRETLHNNHSQLYRLGGDEFAILSPNCDSKENALRIGEAINTTLRRPIEVEGVTLELGGSIGIACFPDHGENSDSLLRCADVAMYRAKSGASGAVIYDPCLDSHTPRRLAIMSQLGTAIREEQLILYFQPRVDINTHRCVGCEALIRWQHPTLGLIEPEEFIPLAEMSDLIRPLSMWVLRSALSHVKMWQQEGLNLGVAINVSTRNLLDLNYPEYIKELLKEYQIPPHLLDIEITESAIISDPERSLKVVDRIHDLGVTLAIDDFGTGYSSLSYLKRLPIQLLKIDRSFIQDLIHDEQDSAIVRSTIKLAHSFDIAVVAEGVEDQLTLEELKRLGCEYGQGYYFKYPLPGPEFKKWLKLQDFEGVEA